MASIVFRVVITLLFLLAPEAIAVATRKIRGRQGLKRDQENASTVGPSLPIRLVDSDGRSGVEGRLEIWFPSIFRHHSPWNSVCDDHFGVLDAEVACRQLGYGGGEVLSNSVHGGGVWDILGDDFECSGFESYLEDCEHNGGNAWGVHNCDHSEDVGVRCAGIRLVGGSRENEGRLEVFHDGSWGTVCDDHFVTENAVVVCRALGFLGGEFYLGDGGHGYGEGSGQIWLDELKCDGSEIRLDQCEHNGWGSHNCDHGEDVGIRCMAEVRLAGGTSDFDFQDLEGRLEVFTDSSTAAGRQHTRWGTVCDDDFDAIDAKVACAAAGLAGGEVLANSVYGAGNEDQDILMDDLGCDGSEVRLGDCSHTGFNEQNCEHDEDVGVRCRNTRLVGGSGDYEGRLEVLYRSRWGTVCDDDFGLADAKVACAAVGFAGGEVVDNSVYGVGSVQILLDGLQCDGSESRLDQCIHNDWGVHNCRHSEDVGVRCSTVRLVGGTSHREGRLEVFNEGGWGTVCDDYFGTSDAEVVCRELGFVDVFEVAVLDNSVYGEGSGDILLDNLGCDGSESHLRDCSHNGWGQHDCGHDEDVGLRCGPAPTSEPTSPTSEPTSPTSEPTSPTSEPTSPTSEPTSPTTRQPTSLAPTTFCDRPVRRRVGQFKIDSTMRFLLYMWVNACYFQRTDRSKMAFFVRK